MSAPVRPMRLDDLSAVHALQLSAFAPELHEPLELFQRIFATSPASCFVAETSPEKIAGYLLAYPSRPDRDDFEHGPHALTGAEDALYIHDLCIAPALQRKRIGKTLLSQALIFSNKKSLKHIYGIAVGNAAPFWARQGFAMTRPCTYHGTPATWMTLDLNRS